MSQSPVVGISGFAACVPPYRVCLQAWSEWTGNDWSKIGAVVGRSFRIRGPEQSVYTLAATAVLRLIERYDIDPSRVRFLGLGTESSTDNSAGAVIVKGMLNEALSQLGRPPMARGCEVPEFKHACLGGVYAMKSALRYLATDGSGAQAIVVSADLAQYARGSTGEQTQGAGAIAMLLEENPKLAVVDLAGAGSASDYRGLDFRKPLVRFTAQTPGHNGHLNDFPVFNGRYSTVCYMDETIQALNDLYGKRELDASTYLRGLPFVFMHRPYRRMPETGLALAWLTALASGSDADREELAEYCHMAGETPGEVLAEMECPPDIAGEVSRTGSLDFEIYPHTLAVLRAFRGTGGYRAMVEEKLSLGAGTMAELGNLYTASLPAWLAAGLEEAAARGMELTGREILSMGYGSGDAAEAIPITLVDGWREAAGRIGIAEALAGAVDLSREQYEALHAGTLAEIERPRGGEFIVERIGRRTDSEAEDEGVEYYAYLP